MLSTWRPATFSHQNFWWDWLDKSFCHHLGFCRFSKLRYCRLCRHKRDPFRGSFGEFCCSGKLATTHYYAVNTFGSPQPLASTIMLLRPSQRRIWTPHNQRATPTSIDGCAVARFYADLV